MRAFLLLTLLAFVGGLAQAQLTMDQKVSDFQYMASIYAKRYGPYEWKRDVLQFDLLNVAPWLTKITATKNDLDFYDVMSEYVSSLNDAHDGYSIPSTFVGRLNFTVDVFEGLLLVDSINRTRLPAAEFPFAIGYELVSIDGVDAQRMLDRLLRYEIAANVRSTRRLAATLLTVRPQQLISTAPNLPEISTVVFRRPDGQMQTYRIPWAKSGLPIETVGRYPASPGASDEPEQTLDYRQLLDQMQNCRLPDKGVLNFGARAPVFAAALGSGFTQRLGRVATDTFFSGVFEVGPYKIGFIRIPNYAPADTTLALTQFAQEIAFFQANTDGLVVDEMRNPGGSVLYANQVLSFLIPNTWNSIPFEVRATAEWVLAISSALEQAKAQAAPAEMIAQLEMIKEEIRTANRAQRGMTNAIPLDDVTIERSPAKDEDGNVIAYQKPLIMLIDELSASGGDYVPATIQDNGRGPLFGWRTMGAGGNVVGWSAGSYSLGFMTVTESLMRRNIDVVTPDFPLTRYVENVGVRPDIEYDYMTRENLVTNGAPFVDAFLLAIYNQIQSSR